MSSASLLESFPSPPTHIPNPPPSLPPSLPLPPLPGPSPISDNFLRRSIASHRDSIASFVSREDALLSPPDRLFAISIPSYALSDIDDDDDDDAAELHLDESISDIQLPLTDDDEDDGVLTATNASDASIADPIDPATLHLQKRPPRKVTGNAGPTPRSVSPDIQAILSKTPRPRKQRSSNLSKAVGMSAASRPLPRRVSDGDIAIQSNRRTKFGLHNFTSDYRVTIPSLDLDEAKIEENLGRQLKNGDSDSDSSIDMHTPLPHLMVRDGLLSPRSKLLPQVEPTSSDFRGSVYSIASNASSVAKSRILKDIRDTPMRRHRHRDGRLLRGGIGLTTGLGWSDSEDEDAPSPLTRRLSSLNLSRRASASSVHSAHTNPLSRSISSSRVLEEPEDYENYDPPLRPRSITLSTSPRYSAKPAHPPTSWQSRPNPGSRLSSSSAGSKDSIRLSISEQSDYPTTLRRSASGSDNGFPDTLNTPSTASTLSIPTPSTPADEPILRKPIATLTNKNKSLPPLPALSLRKIPSNISLSNVRQGARPRTISSTSSVSSASHGHPSAPIPPLPAASSSSATTPRPLKLVGTKTRQSQSQPQTPTFRGGGVDRPAVPVPTISSAASSLRPLAASTAIISNPRSLPRLASRLPSKSPTAGSSPLSSPISPSSSVPDMALPRPKPRIGSGMVYRTSSYSSLDGNAIGGSKLRIPRSLTLTTSVQPIPSARSASTTLPSRAGMFRAS